jgi:polynucleotide 5'-kinase involved in rRNA processing
MPLSQMRVKRQRKMTRLSKIRVRFADSEEVRIGFSAALVNGEQEEKNSESCSLRKFEGIESHAKTVQFVKSVASLDKLALQLP